MERKINIEMENRVCDVVKLVIEFDEMTELFLCPSPFVGKKKRVIFHPSFFLNRALCYGWNCNGYLSL